MLPYRDGAGKILPASYKKSGESPTPGNASMMRFIRFLQYPRKSLYRGTKSKPYRDGALYGKQNSKDLT
jgi:hypothetical protein